jgi:threonine dehydrogenase-like Zn-dependent dehydrogenase
MTINKVFFDKVESASLVSEQLEDRPLEPREVAGKTLFSLISAGTELNIYLGNYVKQGLSWGQLPFVPGYAAVFRVEEVGSEVEDIKTGDVVYCMGKHASWQRHPRQQVIPLPDGLAPEIGPFARLANISMSALTTTKARPPARVVITGLGLVGLMGAMIFRSAGYEVIAVDPVQVRRDLASARGIPTVLPAVNSAITGQVPLVLDCSGHEQAILDGLKIVEPGGEVVVAGVPMVRRTEIFAQEVLNTLFRSFASLRSGKEQQVAAHPTPFRVGSQFGNMSGVLDWLAQGRFSAEGLYDKVSPKDAQNVYQDTLHMRGEKLAHVFDWGLI